MIKTSQNNTAKYATYGEKFRFVNYGEPRRWDPPATEGFLELLITETTNYQE